MNLQQLEYFIAIYETKNFTEASSQLAVTQPALSKAIAKLEEELDVPLFEREGRKIKATNYGEAFLKYAQSSLNEIERGKEMLADMKNKNESTISIGSTYCIGSVYIPFIISRFLNTNLNAKFSFHTEPQEQVLKDLHSGKIELGFVDNVEQLRKYPEIETALIREEEFVLIVSKNHHLSNREEVWLEELKEEYFIGFQSKDKKISYSELMGFTPKIAIEPDDTGMYAGLVAEGVGIAIVLNTSFLSSNRISVIKIKDTIAYKSIYMAWNREHFMAKSTVAFRDFVLNLNEEV